MAWSKSFGCNFHKEVSRIHNGIKAMRDNNNDLSRLIENGLKENLNRVPLEEELYWKQC